MAIRVLGTELRMLNMRTRIPFKFGIVTMTAAPHLFVRVEAEIDGERYRGISADHLPPKWFTKIPQSPLRDDVAELLQVIETACDVAKATPKSATVFEFWRRLYQGMAAWGGGWGKPPLLSHFGTSLIERAVIDAYCRAHEITFAAAVRSNRLGIDVGSIHAELGNAEPKDLLPAVPLRSVVVRHTVGLSDPLTDAEISDADRVDDGLPQSLESAIRAYELTYFKIKLIGDVERDTDRVRRVAEVIERVAGSDYRHTLDGNENFKTVQSLREFWEALSAQPALERFLSRLIFVEQPLHRDVALSEQATREFSHWTQRPPTIIDESDGEMKSASAALSAGYVGTSHKNCKGVFKGIVNACLIEHRRRQSPAGRFLISSEDLSNVGPIALQQDLAVLATLGITHSERNGHHYFRGLSMLPNDLQQTVLQAHPDLFTRHSRGFATSRIDAGRMAIGSALDAPFGVAFEMPSAQFTPAEQWSFDSL